MEQWFFCWQLQAHSSESLQFASVANQGNAASHAHSATAAHRCDPFSHPSDPFNPYPKM
jgi:hypothetical protein